MKQRYWLWKRNGVYYLDDALTRKKESLRTRDLEEAEKIRNARNAAVKNPTLGAALARAYLTAYDQATAERTWTTVMAEQARHGRASTRARCLRESRSKPYDLIRDKPLIESTAADLIAVLAVGKASTCHFLRRFHNLAVDLGWLPWPILPNRLWPKAQKAKRRGITLLEHEKILGAEQNIERKLYYELLWETGASQTDAAQLTSDNINWDSRVLAYHRQKLAPDSKPAVLAIGKTLERILKQLLAEGPLFPHLIALKNTDRAAEFYRRCHLLGINGVSLHSYRYAWAERAKVAGIPQRWAEAALGHSSAAIHRAYAQGAQVVCPPLDEYADTRGGNSGSFQRV